MMTPRLQRRMRTAAFIVMACVPVALAYEFIDTRVVSAIGLFVGLLLALPLIILEESSLDEKIRRLPFSVAVIGKSLIYIASIAAAFITASLVVGTMQGRTMEEFWAGLFEWEFAVKMTVAFTLYLVIVFFRQLDRLLGPGVLLRYLLGQYHRPRREARIFMFLDLKSSTSLAEQLGPEAYLNLINEFFRDISSPVLDSSGEIYEYVGDEVVLTWKEELGLRDGNCVRVFFDISKAIEKKRQIYLDRFGVVPEFKAGLHLGEVMTAEIGDLKKGLVFNGDVLNTSARIEGECNRLGKRLIASRELLESLKEPARWNPQEIGPVSLRGKAEPLDLVAFA